jgi:hypothetical protein
MDGVESVLNFIFKFLYTANPVSLLTLQRESVLKNLFSDYHDAESERVTNKDSKKVKILKIG